MLNAIFTFLFNIITGLANIVLSPLNSLFVNFFPNFSEMINKLTITIHTYASVNFHWFSLLIPPTTKELIKIWLAFLIAYYTLSFTIHAIAKVFDIIRRIKFW